MQFCRVSFFGHRKMESISKAEEILNKIIADLLHTKEFIEFYVGENGDFDIMATSVIRQSRKKYGTDNSAVNLVLPYKKASMHFYEKQFDSVIIPEELHDVHYKNAITERNKWVIKNSDLIICYMQNCEGGAYHAIQYADKLKIKIINIADMLTESPKSSKHIC